LGCGTGRPTAEQLVRAGCVVTGIDISEEMLRLAKERVPGATFERGDILTMDLPEQSFDAVTCFFVLLMLRRTEMDQMLRRIHHTLAPGGHFACSMVEGDFDGIDVPFLGQTVRVSAYPLAAFVERLNAAGFTILEQKEHRFVPAGSDSSETQLFFLCKRI
ncbi:MAG: class I SAM-dependent methyltransferase, partial [Polyangiaceae bacterium]|nr:class I SAM-dependent methyltransferase [Polyangiaceae bacterium]